MSGQRIDMYRLQELVRLHRMGVSCREVARQLAMSPNTERAYRRALEKAQLLAGEPEALPELEALTAAVREHAPSKPTPHEVSSAAPWKQAICTMLERGAGPKAIYDRLRLEEQDFSASLSAVKRLCVRLKQERGVQPQDVVIPVETAPGEVAQVDFGYVGRLYDPSGGRTRKAWVFVMVLGYSRLMVADLVFDQKVTTWLELHRRAFEQLGGVPKVIVPDNLKAAVVRAAFGVDEQSSLNRSYREMARHYGFQIDPAPVRSPEKKGKVEAGVKYVKRNFFAPRDTMDIEPARTALSQWLDGIANERVHGVTHRKPGEMFEAEENQALLALPSEPWEPVEWKQAKVHRDSHVQFDKRLYSVPWRFLGKPVWVRATASTVAMYADDERIATHRRSDSGHRSTYGSHLPDKREPYRHRARAYWQERADALGDEVGHYIRGVFDVDDVLSQLRTVQSMVTHLETFPEHRARAACVRAHYYGNYRYRGLKQILKNGLDMEPLPTAVEPPHGYLSEPRYARTPGQLLDTLEVYDEHH